MHMHGYTVQVRLQETGLFTRRADVYVLMVDCVCPLIMGLSAFRCACAVISD